MSKLIRSICSKTYHRKGKTVRKVTETFIVGGSEVDVDIEYSGGNRLDATVKLVMEVEVAGSQLEEFMDELGTLIDTYQN